MKTLIVLLTEITVWSTLMATTVAWELPREGSCHEGIPFADGRTGVLVWGGGDTINLTVGRGENARAYGKAGDAEGAEIMQMDGQCAAAAAVMELMVHEVNGRVRYFRGCPASWRDVSFENLRLANGKRVSGRRTDGVIEIEERAGKE